MPVSVIDMVQSAKAAIQNLTPQQVHDELQSGEVTLIDIREPDELVQNGRIPGSTNAPRGMLEFYADETLPYYRPEFDRNKRIILQCASGGRSALATHTLMQMGYSNIAHLDGGINAWKDAGLPLE